MNVIKCLYQLIINSQVMLNSIVRPGWYRDTNQCPNRLKLQMLSLERIFRVINSRCIVNLIARGHVFNHSNTLGKVKWTNTNIALVGLTTGSKVNM